MTKFTIIFTLLALNVTNDGTVKTSFHHRTFKLGR